MYIIISNYKCCTYGKKMDVAIMRACLNLKAKTNT